jgi:uncharacterized protein
MTSKEVNARRCVLLRFLTLSLERRYSFQVMSFRIEELTPQLEAFFLGRPEVTSAYVFGSVARGTAGRLSDLDLAVLVSDDVADRLLLRLDLIAEITALLSTERLDLVILNDASPLLAHRAFTRGVPLFVRDTQRDRDFRDRATHRYLDTGPLRELQARALTRRLDEGRFGRG